MRFACLLISLAVGIPTAPDVASDSTSARNDPAPVVTARMSTIYPAPARISVPNRYTVDVAEEVASGAGSTSLGSILNDDGTLNLDSGFSGSLDVSGWSMDLTETGAPRFVPEAADAVAVGDEIVWDDQFTLRGANATISAIAIAGDDIYVGGSFTVIGGIRANSIARWDGSSWHPLGSGTDQTVRALAFDGTNLFVGGGFTSIGGVSANHIARWDGSSWYALGPGVDSGVGVIAVGGGNVYAGGVFLNAGGVAVNRIARWDGSSWHALGVGVDNAVTAILVDGPDVWVAGYFVQAGGVAASRVARWDGSSWYSLGLGLNDRALAIAATQNGIVVGGSFTVAGGILANRIARWDGSAWHALGSGVNQAVLAIASHGTDVYVAGSNFTSAGGVAAARVAHWDGASWSAMSTGVNHQADAIVTDGVDVYVAGIFSAAGGTPANRIARWDGGNWHALGAGSAPNNTVWDIEVVGADVYMGGTFTNLGGTLTSGIARWDGTTWHSLGSGINGFVYTIALGDDGDLLVGGSFSAAGGVSVNNIARWDGSMWHPLASGLDGYVRTIAIQGGNVFAGGDFAHSGGLAVARIACWDGAAWHALGTGVNSAVMSIAAHGSDLIVGGFFTIAGGLPAARVARWDGTSWHPLGSGTTDAVFSVATVGADVYVGGVFTTAGGIPASRIARWDGSAWYGVDGGVDAIVQSLTTVGTNLYVGGAFTVAGSVQAEGIARWDGSEWIPIGGGVDPAYVLSTAIDGDKIYVGGSFLEAGGSGSVFLAVGTYVTPLSSTRFVTNSGGDSPNDCLFQSSPCATIKYALSVAESGDAIDIGPGTYTESHIVITKDLTIIGAGADQTIVQPSVAPGGSNSRGFSLGTGVDVTIERLTVRHANATGIGGGVLVQDGSLTLRDVRLTTNVASNNGAALASGGDVVIERSLIDNNTATHAGGIYIYGGSISIDNTTFSANLATGGQGGALWNANGGATVSFTNSTITDNTAVSNSGGITGSNITIRNTIVAGNQSPRGPDCRGLVNSDDFNLIGDATECTISGSTSHTITGQAPVLTVLRNNGGPTPTHGLYDESPALDAGSCDPSLDQRGVARPADDPSIANVDNGCDIGAFEGSVGPKTNTEPGTDVTTNPVDPTTGEAPVGMSFDEVLESGETSLEISGTGAPPPNGFKLGSPPTYFDLTTTAVFAGAVEICIDYSTISYGQESLLKLFHLEGGAWTDITTSVDTEADIICGETTSLSPFAVFERLNLAPEILEIGGPPDPVHLDSLVTVTGLFEDPNDPGPHTSTWSWGDGQSTDGAVDGYEASGSHAYANPGVYTVTLTVVDFEGAADTLAFEYVVIYDPEGGFVTGGGWIESPAEACPDFCGGASGKANFGFVSKYKKGQSVPSGETEFNFKAGDLNFHSASYDWLVVAGPQAKFKGDGTINGQGDYAFMLSAIDGNVAGGGDADKFRIKIWTNDEAESIVYDNQLGDSDDADASDEIEGGSIVIHDGKTTSKGVASDAPAELPDAYALHQNYPNPFNPVTNIGFDLPEAGLVRIRVIDMLGREVVRLVDRELKAGRHTVSFEAGSLPSSVYLLQMDAGAFAAVRRMVLLK